MKRISAKVLRYALECAVCDRMSFAEANEGCGNGMSEDAMLDVGRFRGLMRDLFGNDSTFIERGARAFAHGKTSMSIMEIKRLLDHEAVATPNEKLTD